VSKIGTGEGAQAYGHGLYFAERPEVAGTYRPSQLYPQLAYGREGRKWVLREFTGGGQSKVLGEFATKRDAAAATDAILGTRETAPRPGATYKVELNASPDEFLDWDKPLSQQSPRVREILEREWLAHPEAHARQTGEQIYRSLDKHQLDPMGQASASAKLREVGIRGIRYLDQGSRAAGRGTYNYVVFDDAIIKMLERGASPAQILGLLAATSAAGLTAAAKAKK
jgi:hypothetical protein